MHIIERNQILPLITAIAAKGARPIELTMRTSPKCNVKSRITGLPTPQGIEKVSMVNGFLNFDYEASVNRQLAREDKAQSFKTRANWFEHCVGDARPIVRHRNDHSKVYVQVKSERVDKATYYVQGLETPLEQLAEYLPPKSIPQNQGTDKPIFTFTVALDSITSFICDGESYQIASDNILQSIAIGNTQPVEV